MSLLFNTLSRFVTAFLPRSKRLLTSWLQSLSTVILESKKKIKSVTASTFFPFYLSWSDGTRCHDLSFLTVEFQASFFTLLFHSHQEALDLFFCLWMDAKITAVGGSVYKKWGIFYSAGITPTIYFKTLLIPLYISL